MTNGNSNVCSGISYGDTNQLLSAEMILQMNGARAVSHMPMWHCPVLDRYAGMEVPFGIIIGIMVLGGWYGLRRWTGWAWLVFVVGLPLYGQQHTIRLQNTTGSAIAVKYNFSTDGTWPTLTYTVNVPASSTVVHGTANAGRNGGTYAAYDACGDGVGIWTRGPTYADFDVTLTLTGCGAFTDQTGGLTNSPITNAVLKLHLLNGTGSNQNYKVFLNGASQGNSINVGPGASLDFDYTGVPGNIEIRTEQGRVVWSVPNNSPYWFTPTPDGTGVPMTWYFTDTGGVGTTQRPPAISWTNWPSSYPTNPATDGQLRQGFEVAHDDALQIQRALVALNYSLTNGGGGGSGTNSEIDYRPHWGTNNTALQGATNLLGGILNLTNVGNTTNLAGVIGSVIEGSTGVVNGFVQSLLTYASNKALPMATNFTTWTNRFADFGIGGGVGTSGPVSSIMSMSFITPYETNIVANCNPLDIPIIKDQIPWVRVVLRWLTAIFFIDACWRIFAKFFIPLTHLQGTAGLTQSGFGTNVSGPTGLVYALAFLAFLIIFAASWQSVGWAYDYMMLDPSTHSTVTTMILEAIRLLKVFVPLEFVTTCYIAYWAWRVSIQATYGIIAVILRFRLAVWVVGLGLVGVVCDGKATEFQVQNMSSQTFYIEQGTNRFECVSNVGMVEFSSPSASGTINWNNGLPVNRSYTLLNTQKCHITFNIDTNGSMPNLCERPYREYTWPYDISFTGLWVWFYGGLAVGCSFVAFGWGKRMVSRIVYDGSEAEI